MMNPLNKNQKYRSIGRVIAVFLVVVLLLIMIPNSVFAASQGGTTGSAPSSNDWALWWLIVVSVAFIALLIVLFTIGRDIAKRDFPKKEEKPKEKQEVVTEEKEPAELSEEELFSFAEFDEKKSEVIVAPRYSYWKSVWKTFFGSKVTIAFFVLVVIVVAFAFIYPMISHFDPMNPKHPIEYEYHFLSPSFQHIFGTDGEGNEVFDVVWSGARNSLIVSLVATAIDMVIGIIVGALWGFSKKMDKWMIEVYNVIANVPFLLLAMILAYVLRNKFNFMGEIGAFVPLIFTMTITEWIFVAYFIRTQVMIIRDREYNLASKCLGTSTWTMITRNILPYLISVIMTYISRQIPSLISYEVFLSYMGLGLDESHASLGRTISQYTTYMRGYPHLFWIPVLIVAVISISLYIVGQKLADAADPRTHR